MLHVGRSPPLAIVLRVFVLSKKGGAAPGVQLLTAVPRTPIRRAASPCEDVPL
jgi:hypothetical protein